MSTSYCVVCLYTNILLNNVIIVIIVNNLIVVVGIEIPFLLSNLFFLFVFFSLVQVAVAMTPIQIHQMKVETIWTVMPLISICKKMMILITVEKIIWIHTFFLCFFTVDLRFFFQELLQLNVFISGVVVQNALRYSN